MKNRLKKTLHAGKTYCVKFHINIANTSPRAIDGFGIYFGNNSIDTITKCNIPLTYITPQVQNPPGNVISDTLSWIPITGTFVANGTEKYALIGNFLADNAVTTASINTPYYPAYWSDVCIDDVSCIEMDLPAYAGPDKSFMAGDSVYIGRESDFAIDPGCVWYALPNATPIATISGLWVKPLVTTTYVVRQELECSSLKWDTVVVFPNPVGLQDLMLSSEHISVYPNPTNDLLQAKLEMANDISFNKIFVYNHLGQLLREEDVVFKEKEISVSTADLLPGIYQLKLCGTDQTVSRKFVVSR